VIRFRLQELISQREIELGRRLPRKEIAEATGISPQVLSGLTNPSRNPVTNTAFVESLCRYFRCEVGELIELRPGLDEEVESVHVDRLYPDRGN
jgi:putative transcriptional regulator